MNRREKLEDMLTHTPDDPFLHYGLAMEHRKAGELPEALACLARAIECDANYVAAYFHRGQILAEQGDTGAARQNLRDGIGIARRTGDGHAAEEMTGLLDALQQARPPFSDHAAVLLIRDLCALCANFREPRNTRKKQKRDIHTANPWCIMNQWHRE